MPIVSADLVQYAAANMPDDDTSTVGGAIDETARPLDTQMAASDTIDVVSSSASDTTQTVTVTGRLASGAVDTEVYSLAGTTPQTGSKTFERVLSIVMSATAVGSVTIERNTGGVDIHVLAPGETDAYIGFRKAVSAAGAKTYYEKWFWKNTHASLALTSAQIALTAEPGTANIQVALEDARNDNGTSTNRLTVPTGLDPTGWVDDSTAQDVPGTELGDDTTGTSDHIGMWIRLELGSSQAAEKTSFTTQLSGQTT